MKTNNLSKSATTPPLLLLISAIALIVSGCGGGGSSGGAPVANTGGGNPSVNPMPSIPTLGSSTVEQSAVRGFQNILSTSSASYISRVRTLIDSARDATSSASGNSISQSSGSSATTVTTETDSLTLAMGALATVQSDDDTPTAQVRGSQDYTMYYLSESHDGADPSNTNPQVVEAVAYTTRTADTTDYTTFGFWLVDSDGQYNTGNPEIAAFAYGSGALTPSAYLRPATEVTATYRGDAVGLIYSAGSANNQIFGTVELTATFDSTPTVQGRITDINTPVPVRLIPFNLTGLVLAEASLANAAGGLFTGDASGGGYSGNWGGRFHGDEAEIVSGTFDAFSNTADYRLIGSFGAIKETPTE